MTARTIAWGLYLATSWTWCIGMYLPVILIDRFGWPGFIAFAIPNIAGVVIFGYVVRGRTRSELLIDRHGSAMRWFSIVTIAFHMFFLMALAEFAFGALPESPYATTAVVAGPFVVALLVASLSIPFVLLVTVAAWIASVMVFAEIGTGGLEAIAWNGRMSTLQLAPIAVILLLGFLLCPYFDLTFHRAVRESPTRHCFAVFPAAFAVMLLLTLALWNETGLHWRSLAFGHLLWQSATTMGLHLRELREVSVRRDRLTTAAALAAPLVGLGLGMWAVHNGVSEPVYIRFLVFYGLVFPAYAVMFMHPLRPLHATRRSWSLFALAVILSAPFFEFGFIHAQTWLLLFPIAGAVAWLACRARRPVPQP
jgi:hypothetical protein